MLNQLGLDHVVQDGMLKIGVASTLSNSGPFHRMGHFGALHEPEFTHRFC